MQLDEQRLRFRASGSWRTMPDATLDASYHAYRSVPIRRPDPACHKYSAGNINRLTPRSLNASA
ncbi:hypothetical protein O5964_26345, partial [Escherichia coli]|nr:hypothetical protein [Escherichia coli]